MHQIASTMKLASLVLLSTLGCASARPAVTPVAACATGSPLDGASVAAVHPLVDQVTSENKKFAFTRVVGAEVVLAAEDGVTVESLERRARCHSGKDSDPLAVAGAAVRVRSREGAFALQITSKDPASAREILARAERLPR